MTKKDNKRYNVRKFSRASSDIKVDIPTSISGNVVNNSGYGSGIGKGDFGVLDDDAITDISTVGKHYCIKCKVSMAVWCYMPSDWDNGYYCDECIPRGCSCNIIDFEEESPDAEQRRDALGRLYPCIEYEFNEYGFKNE